MKYTPQELLFASTVRELAHGYWQRARDAAFAATGAQRTQRDEVPSDFTATFAAANPLANFIPKALGELEATMALIEALSRPVSGA